MDIGRFPCDRAGCNKHFVSAGGARAHAANVHDGLRFPCGRDGCNGYFVSAGGAWRHAANVHDGLRFPW